MNMIQRALAALGPGLWVPNAIDQVRHEKATEEHDFGDEKHPHTERGGFVLLIQRLKMVLQRRIVCVPVQIGVCGKPVRQL